VNFREWLKINENGTSTAAVAHFRQPIGDTVRRTFAQQWAVEDPFFKKKKKRRKKRRKK